MNNRFPPKACGNDNTGQTLINDLLAFSRIQTRGKQFTATDMEAIWGQVQINFQKIIEENNAVITRHPLPTIFADGTQMVQLLQNLIENAIKFRSKENPKIQINAEQKNKEWVFTVKDNGIGIDPNHQERIFTIFERLHNSKIDTGTGIGLAICKKIVERHGGRIWVESDVGKGSTFYFSLPIKK